MNSHEEHVCDACGKSFSWFVYFIAHKSECCPESLGDKFQKVLNENRCELYD